MKTLPENALLGMIVVGFLAFFGIQGMGLLTALSETPHEESHQYHDISESLSQVEYGAYLVKNAGCMGCHNLEFEIPSEEGTSWAIQGGVLGPSLNNVAVRWRSDRENLAEKIRNPEASLPNSYMPSFAYLSDAEVDAIVSFLLTLDGSRQPEISYEEPKDVGRFTQAQINAGEELFKSQSCSACHTVSTVDPQIFSGNIGPNLSWEAHRNRSDEWQKDHIANSHSVYVMGEANTQVICSIANCMNSYASLSNEQLNNLVAFIQSLQ